MATFERHLKVKELAALWGLSPKTITRLFENEPGVIRYGKPEERYKRAYFKLLIPQSVAQRVHERLGSR